MLTILIFCIINEKILTSKYIISASSIYETAASTTAIFIFITGLYKVWWTAYIIRKRAYQIGAERESLSLSHRSPHQLALSGELAKFAMTISQGDNTPTPERAEDT